jgi:hypothetical protein
LRLPALPPDQAVSLVKKIADGWHTAMAGDPSRSETENIPPPQQPVLIDFDWR